MRTTTATATFPVTSWCIPTSLLDDRTNSVMHSIQYLVVAALHVFSVALPTVAPIFTFSACASNVCAAFSSGFSWWFYMLLSTSNSNFCTAPNSNLQAGIWDRSFSSAGGTGPRRAAPCPARASPCPASACSRGRSGRALPRPFRPPSTAAASPGARPIPKKHWHTGVCCRCKFATKLCGSSAEFAASAHLAAERHLLPPEALEEPLDLRGGRNCAF